MAKRPDDDVAVFLAALVHARKPEIDLLRTAILRGHPTLTEQIKWNAPSFGIDGADRVTFRLQPKDRVELIFHRGAKQRDDVDTFTFSDPTGLISWATPDRGVVVLADAAHTELHADDIVRLVGAWLVATTG